MGKCEIFFFFLLGFAKLFLDHLCEYVNLKQTGLGRVRCYSFTVNVEVQLIIASFQHSLRTLYAQAFEPNF